MLPLLGIVRFVVPGTTCTGGSCEALTIGSVTAWHMSVLEPPLSNRQNSESGSAFWRSWIVLPTTAPATRTPFPMVVVPLFEPTSPSTARTPFCSVTSPRPKTA